MTKTSTTAKPLNVLFVCADDLRPSSLGCYGDPIAVTPNFDRLAASGTLFNRAYCHQALCGPSRASLMTGRRLDFANGLPENFQYRSVLPDVVTLPQLFKNHSWHCVSFGKVNHLHPYVLDPESWSEPEQCFEVTKRDEYLRPENRLRGFINPMSYGTASEEIETPEDAYQDGQAVTAAIEKLRRIKDEKFFMAVGFKRPHLPFSAPKKYWDLYDPDTFPALEAPDLPPGSGEAARWRYYENGRELRQYTDMPNDPPIPEGSARRLRHAYYACASYIDAQLGRLLDELEDLGLREQTAVVFWADHGFHLGESGLWAKKTNTELDTRVPLLLSLPGQNRPGSKTDALTELIDLYPTLAELAGLEAPPDLDGASRADLLDDPMLPGLTAAFSQYRDPAREIWGCTLRTDSFRYTEWFPAPRRDDVVDRELYQIEEDPFEQNNLADKPEYREEAERLSRLLRAYH